MEDSIESQLRKMKENEDHGHIKGKRISHIPCKYKAGYIRGESEQTKKKFLL